jgi:hypothetical protein
MFIPGVDVTATIDITPLTTATLKVAETPITTTSLFGTIIIGVLPTLVNVSGTDMAPRVSVTIQNNGINAIYVGNTNTVDALTGLYVAPGATVTLNLEPLVATPIYAIALGVPVSVSVMEV